MLLILLGCSSRPGNISIEKSFSKPDINEMTLEQKIAQMIMVRVSGNFYNDEKNNKIKKLIQGQGVGGVITFGGSIHGTFQNIKMFNSWSKIPLFVAADYERGVGQWMSQATNFPTNMAIAATRSPAFAYSQGEITAKEAKALGVNMVLGPVLDVNNNRRNPIINFRSYSENQEVVSDFGSQFIKGIQDAGLLSAAKHYPGHGNTEVDSHNGLAIIEADISEVEDVHLYPFKTAIESGLEMVMVGHIAMASLDPSNTPATHSKKIVENILRNKWGFEGLIITDALEMGALGSLMPQSESIVRAIEAGSDILLLPIDEVGAVNDIKRAVESGRLSEERINISVSRIFDYKDKLNLFDNSKIHDWAMVEAEVGKSDYYKFSMEVASKSITVVKDVNKYLPLIPSEIDSIAHLIVSLDENVDKQLKPFIRDVDRTHGHVKKIIVNNILTKKGIEDILEQCSGVNHIIISILNRIRMNKNESSIDLSFQELIDNSKQLGVPVSVFSFGSPYLIRYDNIDNYICTYGYGKTTMIAAANALWGREKITGVLPISLNEEFKFGSGLKIQKKKKMNQNNLDFDLAWDVLESAVNSKIFPGAQVYIIKGNEVLADTSFGYFTYDRKQKVEKTSIYDVASLTKVLATTPVIMKLIDIGKLSLDHHLHNYFKEFKGPEKSKITVKHLLTHSAGFPKLLQMYKNLNSNEFSQIKKYIFNQELVYTPGEKSVYSDLDMIMLGMLIEKVTGKSLDVIASSYFFNQINLSNTLFNPKREKSKFIPPTEKDVNYRNMLVKGFVHDENAYFMGGVAGHAGLFSNASDIGKFMKFFYDGGIYNGKRILSEAVIEQFIAKQSTIKNSDWALGWDTPSVSGKGLAGRYFSETSFGHTGFTGVSTWCDYNNKVAVVLLTNRIYPSRPKDSSLINSVRTSFHNSVMKKILGK